jgi:hypothetical protein
VRRCRGGTARRAFQGAGAPLSSLFDATGFVRLRVAADRSQRSTAMFLTGLALGILIGAAIGFFLSTLLKAGS